MDGMLCGYNEERRSVPAAAAGLRTILVNRNASRFPAGRSAPDATIDSLAQLFEVLSEPYTRGLLALRHILRTALDWRPGHLSRLTTTPRSASSARTPEIRRKVVRCRRTA